MVGLHKNSGKVRDTDAKEQSAVRGVLPHHIGSDGGGAAVPPGGAGGKTDLRPPQPYLRLRSGLVGAPELCPLLEERFREAGIEAAGFHTLMV